MKTDIYNKLSLILLGMSLLGCGAEVATPSKGESAPGAGKGEQVAADQILNPIVAAPEEVLVVVNGKPITCGEFQARLALEGNVFKYRRRKSQKSAQAREREMIGFLETRVAHIMPILINQILVKEALAKAGLSLDEAMVSNEMSRVYTSFAVKGKKNRDQALAKLLEMDAAYLEDQFLEEPRMRLVYEHFDPSCRSVSEQEIDEGLARQTRYYERAIASNTVTYATCSNVLNKVVNEKMDFKAAVLRYSVDPDNADEGEEFDLEDFETDVAMLKPHLDRLKKWAFSAPIGSVSGPWEMEDGLAIVKILSREAGSLNRSVVSLEEEAEVTLGRIVFEMLDPEPEPRTREFVKESLLKWKATRAQKAMFQKLHDEMKLVYPHGKKIVYKFADQNVKEK